MRRFTLATFYSPNLTELKVFYRDGAARVRVLQQLPFERVLMDVSVEDAGPALVQAIKTAFANYPEILPTGTFYDSKGNPFSEETFSAEHLAFALHRALTV